MTVFSPVDFSAEIGTTIIEASAGTGKTTAIAALTVRALAERWCTIDRVMLVTFGRKAASELRTKFHARLTNTIACLRGVRDAREVSPLVADDVHAHFLAASPSQQAEWLTRLEAAMADFDRATIATTHQFCLTMLSELGVLADFDAHASFLDDSGDLLTDAWADAQLITGPSSSTVYNDVAKELRGWVAESPLPLTAGLSGDGAHRLSLAEAMRTELEIRKWSTATFGFDDMVVRLHRALDGSNASIDRSQLSPSVAAARHALSERYRLVMIDEYQDTDTLQWQIARAAFHGHSRLLLIGDPKQAIYGFRGADVRAYLAARGEAGARQQLVGNHRSSPEVVQAVDALLRGRALGNPEITVPHAESRRPEVVVEAPDGHRRRAVELRLALPAGEEQVHATEEELASQIDADVVRVVNELRHSHVVVDGVRTRIKADQIAVLVRTNARGRQLHQALLAADVPAVFAGSDSVWACDAATDFAAWLAALVRPSAESIRRAALTDLVGLSLASLSAADDAELSEIALALRESGRLLDDHSVAAAFDLLSERFELQARLLRHADGERRLTDLRHVAELLHDHAVRHPVPVKAPGARASQLASWLRARQQRAKADERTRRLETDRSAVQIMTVHRAKGLSLPVVLLPDLGTFHSPTWNRSLPTIVHHGDQPQIDVAPTRDQADLRRQEEADETLRLLYVALTRARFVMTLWWGPHEATEASPLNRVLQATEPDGVTPAPSIAATARQAPELVRRWSQHFAVTEVPHAGRPPAMTAPSPVTTDLEARPFNRSIDRAFGRTSYSALTHDPQSHGRPAVRVVDDEPNVDEASPGAQEPVTEPSGGLVSPLGPLPGGTAFGTLVHGVLEDLDWQADDLAAEVRRAVAEQQLQHTVAGVDAEALAEGLEWVVRTPLGLLTDGRALRDLPLTDRLAELDFEMPLAPHGRLAHTVAELAALFDDRVLVPADDPFADYGELLADAAGAATRLAGWITGSIDVVLRVRSAEGTPRHLVLDYKTNRVPVPDGGQLCVDHYDQLTMAQAMMRAHYPLQALLYSVALHRFLTGRLPGYDPARHLGGVGYLFVRGMAGEHADHGGERPHGVFVWLPTPALVLRADQLLTPGRGEA